MIPKKSFLWAFKKESLSSTEKKNTKKSTENCRRSNCLAAAHPPLRAKNGVHPRVFRFRFTRLCQQLTHPSAHWKDQCGLTRDPQHKKGAKDAKFNWIILNFWRLSCLSPKQLARKKRASNTTNFMIFIMPIPMSTARSGVWCLLRTLTWKFTSRGLHFALLSVLKWNFQPTLPLVAACLGFVCAKFGLHWR